MNFYYNSPFEQWLSKIWVSGHQDKDNVHTSTSEILIHNYSAVAQ